MKSVERLREFADELAGGMNTDMLRRLVDDVEQEVSDSYTPLPVDADGEAIHVGDVMVYDHNGMRTSVPEAVKWIAVGEYETHITTEHNSYSRADVLRHYHAPTVEDVLREFAAEIETAGGVMELPDAAFAEYAAKLQLKEG